ncbi:hypothetical protein PMAYCL1PPCAC_00203, partial [Pristionchus mayeri]
EFVELSVRDNLYQLDIIYYTIGTNRDYWLFEIGNERRAIIIPEIFSYSSFVSFPNDIKQFLDDWENSRFIECRNLIKRAPDTAREIPLQFVRKMAELRDFMKLRNVRLLMMGGTLLGWYRECSLIPHTTDIDFAIRIEDYSLNQWGGISSFRNPVLIFYCFQPYDSYELTIRVKDDTSANIDLFFLYTNSNKSYFGGLDWLTRKKYKWSYPRIASVCTGDLLGFLFHVPCNTEDVLTTEYNEWQRDSPSSDFVWHKSSHNVREDGVFTGEDMQQMRPLG